jgi:aminopeptidase YwaD
MQLKADGKELQPGKDFIVYPASAAANKTYPVFLCDTTNVIQKLEENSDICLIIPSIVYEKKRDEAAPLLKNKKTGAVIFLEDKKLTWSVAGSQYNIPVITVLSKSFPENIKSVSLHIDAVFNSSHQTQNVIGIVEGSSRKDSFLVFTAHYDHLGGMGKKTFFPGANDNASGTSMLLVLAEYFSKPENKPAYNMVFISFAGEEAGLKGSEYYVQHPLFPLEKIRFLTNLDLLGTGDDGIMVVNATEFKEDFQRLKSINDSKNYVTKINERGKAKNSDHYYFSENGVPAFFIYTMGGVSWYHDVFDKAATLPLTDFNDVFSLLRDFAISF